MLELNIQGKHCSVSWFPFPPKPPIRSLAQLQIVMSLESWNASSCLRGRRLLNSDNIVVCLIAERGRTVRKWQRQVSENFKYSSLPSFFLENDNGFWKSQHRHSLEPQPDFFHGGATFPSGIPATVAGAPVRVALTPRNACHFCTCLRVLSVRAAAVEILALLPTGVSSPFPVHSR